MLNGGKWFFRQSDQTSFCLRMLGTFPSFCAIDSLPDHSTFGEWPSWVDSGLIGMFGFENFYLSKLFFIFELIIEI